MLASLLISNTYEVAIDSRHLLHATHNRNAQAATSLLRTYVMRFFFTARVIIQIITFEKYTNFS